MAGGTGFPFLFGLFGGKLRGMGEALKAEAVFGEGREVVVKLATPDWPEGTRLTITAEPAPLEEGEKVPLSSFFGKARGLFGSVQEVADFIREERNSWDKPEKP